MTSSKIFNMLSVYYYFYKNINLFYEIYLLDSDAHRNAAILAAAAVRAEAAASTKGRVPFPTPNSSTMNAFPFTLRGFHANNDQMPSPFTHSMHSPDYSGIMSPNKEFSGVALSPLSQQGRRTPRSGIPPPPYSPLPHNHESNHNISGSVKGPNANLSSHMKVHKQVDMFTPISYSNQGETYENRGIWSQATLNA